jgi:iron complex outermembrane receptor protein
MKKLLFLFCFCCSFLIFGLSAEMLAQDVAQQDKVKLSQGSLTAISLPEITVYGLADQLPVDPVTTAFGTQFNVITEEQIRRQNSLDFLDALRNVPGVIYQKKNIIGGQTSHSLYIRGRGVSHPSPDLSVFFDDVPRSGVLYGQTLADGIPIYALGGMEVYKYPQPSRFGSGYGMINFVPKYMTEEGQEFRVGFEAGSYSTFAENLAYGYKKGAFDIYTAQSWISSDGHEPHSRAQQQSYYLNSGIKINDNWNIRLLLNYVDAQTLSPFYDRPVDFRRGDRADRYDTQTYFSTLTLNNQFDKAIGYLKFYYNKTNFFLKGENTGTRTSRQTNIISGARFRETLNLWTGSEIVAGFDLDNYKLKNEQYDFVTNRLSEWLFPDQMIFSPYLAVSQTFGQPESFHGTVSAGLRYYRHDLFENKLSTQAGLVLGYNNTNLVFNYARGVNYPSPVILQNALNNGNPIPATIITEDIKPEVVDHYEVGLTHVFPDLARIGLTYFHDNGRDRTRAYMYGATPTTEFFNSRVSRYKVHGFELTGSWKIIENLEFFGGATWLRAKATGDDGKTATKLPFTPSFTLQTGVNWTFLTNFSLNVDYQHISGLYAGELGRTSNPSNPVSNFTDLTDNNLLKDINVVNLRFGYKFNHEPWRLSEAEVFLAVHNLLNENYAYTLDTNNEPYLMPGITFMVGADFKFK